MDVPRVYETVSLEGQFYHAFSGFRGPEEYPTLSHSSAPMNKPRVS